MNSLDEQYLTLLTDILENGHTKKDRTGTGTLSLYGKQIRHKMSEGFPLLTTKKMYFKGVITELIWFLRGDTNIKFLIDNNCHIWDGDAYKNYENRFNSRPNWGEYSKQDYDTQKMWGKATSIPGIDGGYPWTEKYSQEEFINKIKTDDEFAKKWGELGPIYGKQWRDWGGRKTDGFIEYESNGYNENIKGIDQIANLFNELNTNPDSRRMLVNAWNVGELDDMVLPPCHYGFQVYTRELSHEERQKWVINNVDWVKNSEEPEHEANKYLYRGEPKIYGDTVPTRAISLMWNQRSVDVPLGLPFNIASYGLLLTIIAELFNMVPEDLIGNLGDCHIYQNQIEGCKEQITREPFELPKLTVNTEFWQTESGECGVGPLSPEAFLNAIDDDTFCKCLAEDDIQLVNYNSHPIIKFPLSN